MTTYTFVELNPVVKLAYNPLYVQAFLDGMNAYDYNRHPLVPGKEHIVDEQGWSYGMAPRYHDGRVTTRRTAWVYAKQLPEMPEGACAMVYFTTEGEPVGYLTKQSS